MQSVQHLFVVAAWSLMLLGPAFLGADAAVPSSAVEWSYDGPCDGGRACDEDEIEAMEEDLANEMQVSLLQRMIPDTNLAGSAAAGGAAIGAPAGVVLSMP